MKRLYPYMPLRHEKSFLAFLSAIDRIDTEKKPVPNDDRADGDDWQEWDDDGQE